jgi:3-dehydroquinate dehydratase-1
VTVRIGSVELGPGRPKVCVPLTGATVEALEAEARDVPPAVADLVELRIDRFDEVGNGPAVEHAIRSVRAALDPAIPVLFTCRSAREGGGSGLAPGDLERLLDLACRQPGVAAIDVEMETPDGLAPGLAAVARRAGKPVVLSFHDLDGTPSQEEMVGRLVRQQDLGADVVKLACTPSSPEDVLALLAATRAYTARADARPAITMAMGALGAVSRLAGEAFGSVVTFGTVGRASAPGQVDAARLRDALDLLHSAQPA